MTDTYQKVHDFLVQKAGFQITNSNPFKLIDLNGIQLDLLPMVSEELAHFVGLREILEFGSEKISVNDQDFRVATLPSIVLLKLVAWNIRKTDETEDSNIIGLLNELEKGMQEQLE